MSVFERYLTVWVVPCIAVGITFGQRLPGAFQAVGRMDVARVDLPVGLVIWVMVIPALLKVDFGALHQVRQHWGCWAVSSSAWCLHPGCQQVRPTAKSPA